MGSTSQPSQVMSKCWMVHSGLSCLKESLTLLNIKRTYLSCPRAY